MKQLLALCLVLVLVLSFAGCAQEKGQTFFTAEVMQVHAEYLLLEVRDPGSSNLSHGARVEVSTAVVSADGCPGFVPKEYARILLAKNPDHSPPGRLEALAIYKTDETGMVTVD